MPQISFYTPHHAIDSNPHATVASAWFSTGYTRQKIARYLDTRRCLPA